MRLDLDQIDLLDVGPFVCGQEHEMFAVLREQAPVFFNPEPDGPGFYALTRHAHVWDTAMDADRFISGKGTQIPDRRAEGKGHPSIHNADAPIHMKLRMVTTEIFRQRNVRPLSERIRDIVSGLIDAAPRGEPFDFVEHIAVKIPMIVFAEFLGAPEERQMDLVRWANTMSSIQTSEAEQAQARRDLFAYFRTLVAEKRRNPGNDVASVLATGTVDGDLLTDEQLDAYFILLTVAGNETTRFLLTGGLEQLCLQQDDLVLLRQSPDMLPFAVEEMVRWVSPVMQMRRTAIEDCDLYGTPIKAGAKVVLYFVSANRDPRAFYDATSFLIDRKPNPHIGFGIGPHFCLGAHLARLETRIFFEEFFKRVRRCTLAAAGDRLPSNWFRGHTRLMVEWD